MRAFGDTGYASGLAAVLAFAGFMSGQAQTKPNREATPAPVQASPQQNDRALQRHLDLAEKARNRNDTEAELKELLPALDRAIHLRSIELIEHVAGMIGRAYGNIEQPEKGLAVLRRAVAAVHGIAGPESLKTAEFEFEFAMTYVEMGRPAEGQELMREAARKIRQAAGPDSVLLKQVLEGQALMAAMGGKEKESSELMKEADAIEERRHHKNDFGFPSDAHITRLIDEARAALAKKNLTEVDGLIVEATGAADKLDIQNPQRARVWWEAAIVYNTAPVRPERVAKHLMTSLELSEAALGKDPIADVSRVTLPMVHLLQVGAALYTLRGICAQPGAPLDCGAVYERGLADYERALGPNHPAVAGWLGEVSYFLSFSAGQDRLKARNAGAAADRLDPRFDKALSYCRRQLSIYEQAFGKDDPWLAQTVEKLAEIYDWMGNAEAARPLHDRAAQMREARRVSRSEEDEVKYEVRQLRMLLRFDEADERAELYRVHHPESAAKFE